MSKFRRIVMLSKPVIIFKGILSLSEDVCALIFKVCLNVLQDYL